MLHVMRISSLTQQISKRFQGSLSDEMQKSYKQRVFRDYSYKEVVIWLQLSNRKLAALTVQKLLFYSHFPFRPKSQNLARAM